MAKEYYVELAGRKQLLRYTRAERVEIENRFGCDIQTFVYAKAFPLVNGKPTLGGLIECQEALIFYGLRHLGPKITEDGVSKWLQDAVAKGGSIYKPLSEAIVGLLASGVLGWNPPLTEDAKADDDDEEAPGKGQAGDDRAPATVTPIKQAG